MGKEAAGCSLLSLMLFAALPAYGDYELDELPVVLSASRLRQPIKDAPAAVTVIDHEMIKASGSRTLPDLLRLVPGFIVGQLNGNTASVTNQGLADAYSRQMQVLIDGRSIYSPLYGGVNWTDIPIAIADIERIEVVRGPNAATFGANSFLGVINIITREPGTEQGNHFEWTQGSEGVSELTYRRSGIEGDWRYRLTLSQSADRGFAGLYDSQRTEKTNFRGEYQVDPQNQLQLQAGYVGGVRGQGRAEDSDQRDRGVNSGFALVRWTQRNETDDEWWLQYFHDQRSASEKQAYQTIPGLVLDYGMDTRRDDIEFQRTLALSPTVRTSWGGQFRYDAARSLGLLGTTDWVGSNLGRLFGNLEWRLLPSIVANGGVMVERTRLTPWSISPRLAVNWEFVQHHTLRASWGEAERTPTIFEAKANSAIKLNGDLLKQIYFVSTVPHAEKNETTELAYIVEAPSISLSGELRIFASQLKELLATSAVPFSGQLMPNLCGDPNYQCAQSFTNQDNLNLKGVDFTIHWSPFDTTRIYYSGASLLASSSTSNRKELIKQTPRYTESFLLDQQLPSNLRLGIGFYNVDSMKWAGGDQQTGYHKVDVRLAYRFTMPQGQSGELAWVVENASKPTFDFYGYVKPPRVSSLRLSMDF